MEKTIRLKIKKELTREQEKQVIRLKGALIGQGFTDIIHISDEGEEHYINTFLAESHAEALSLIAAYRDEARLEGVVSVLS
ncbi:hypothetical protein LRS05_10520 [Flavobacterium sp. J372]|jgi:hypothetical protein|uniref:hypothetical protein n=1 Tax=Flavobacterium sp. J372 TaxID=2898436 RepID=UPI002150C754|nr:hypothetical protein [Flavobacterium sp. J372]MCR5862554.1 hypothetical protein [Flavobacterium sp. J372]MDC7218186.1 hypothetical protein [Spirochaetales bacterium]